MAWQTEMTIILRVLIDDLLTPQINEDCNLEQLLVVAAQYVNNDIELPKDYTINISAISISPDPTDDPKDDMFINLASMKAACLVDSSMLRRKAKFAGISVKSGPDSISAGGILDGYKHLFDKGWCSVYNAMLNDYRIGRYAAVGGQIIAGPFSHQDLGYWANHGNYRG